MKSEEEIKLYTEYCDKPRINKFKAMMREKNTEKNSRSFDEVWEKLKWLCPPLKGDVVKHYNAEFEQYFKEEFPYLHNWVFNSRSGPVGVQVWKIRDNYSITSANCDCSKFLKDPKYKIFFEGCK